MYCNKESAMTGLMRVGGGAEVILQVPVCV